MLKLNLVLVCSYTKPYDTLANIANRYWWHCDGKQRLAIMQKIIDLNQDRSDLHNPFLYMRNLQEYPGEQNVPLRPFSFYVLPADHNGRLIPCSASDRSDMRYNIRPILNRYAFRDRQQLAHLIEHQQHIGKFAALGEVKKSIYDLGIYASLGAAVALATAEKTLGYYEKTAHHLVSSLQAMNKMLQDYVATPAEEKAALKPLLKETYNNMTGEFNKNINHISVKTAMGSKSILLSSENSLMKAVATHKNFSVMNTTEARSVMRTQRYTKGLGRGIIAVDLGLAGYSIFESYERHENWELEAVEQVGEMAGAWAGSYVFGGLLGESMFLLSLTPVGWVVILVGVIGAMSGSYVAKQLINHVW